MELQKSYKQCFSFEFFPPNTEEGAQKLSQTAKQLAQLKPEFFSVTYGAGGSTRERTLKAVLDMCAAGHASAPHISCICSSRV
ncbi:MAG: methylenetetrahydrofolate reductase, partial [Betaproteobacteria bacterium]